MLLDIDAIISDVVPGKPEFRVDKELVLIVCSLEVPPGRILVVVGWLAGLFVCSMETDSLVFQLSLLPVPSFD